MPMSVDDYMRRNGDSMFIVGLDSWMSDMRAPSYYPTNQPLLDKKNRFSDAQYPTQDMKTFPSIYTKGGLWPWLRRRR